jgi:pimeloyl-ACP methyl ester carboxylesterase
MALCAILAIGGATGARAQEAAGSWIGTLSVGAAQLRLAAHIQKAANGAYSGTLDSLDQGTMALPLANVTVSGGELSFDIPPVHGRYEGRWDAAKAAWVGTWIQGAPLPLVLVRGEPAATPVVAGLDGDWDGALKTGAVTLRLALHIKSGATGTVATLDSIDQGAMGVPLAGLAHDGSKVRFELKAVGGVFEGALAADGASVSGTWRQGGGDMAVTFTRRAPGARQVELKRPQTPKPPFPYREEAVTFDSPGAHAKLSGTLTLPPGKGPFPAVILIAGSGPNTRDETVFGHHVFLVLADHLTRAGLAVLRYDKRGVGASGGDYFHATSRDFADDAQAALAWLRTRADIDGARIGLLGHSEGGLVAPMVAAVDKRLAFVVLLAAPGLNGEEILTLQGALIAKAGGATDAAVAKTEAIDRQAYAAVKAAADSKDAEARARAVFAAAATPAGQGDAAAAQLATDWFRFFLTYDPIPALQQVRCPVLALWGSKDLQVPPAQDLPPVRAALAADKDATVEVLPGLNHLFQTATTGAPAEYASIEETMSPTALERISAWIGARVRR